MNTTTVSISYSSNIFMPEFIKGQQAIVIRSPLDLELRPRTSEYVDTEVKIYFDTNNLQPWMNASPTFKSIGLKIADEERWWLNETKWGTIMLHVQNISFYYNIRIKKGDIIAFVYFTGRSFKIKYNQY